MTFKSTVIAGIIVILTTTLLITSANLYMDVQVLKSQTITLQKVVEERKEATEKFVVFMSHMDKTLAVHTEAVNTLKEAVKRLENGIINYNKEDFNDGRN